MNAKEAKKLAKEALLAQAGDAYDKVVSKIESEAKKGNTWMIFYVSKEHNASDIVSLLKMDGFKAKIFKRNPDYTSIELRW